MTNTEKTEIEALPEKYRPIGAWSYLGYTILFSIPLVGFILLIVFSLSDSNVNRRSYARSYFCAMLIVVIIAVVGCLAIFLLAMVGGASIAEFLSQLSNLAG